MKQTFLTLIICVSVIFNVQCSLDAKEGDLQANNSTSLETQIQSQDLKTKEYTKHLYEAVQNELKGESLKLNVENLRDATSDTGTETRIWVGFGLLYPRCFILKNHDGKTTAFYVSPKVVNNKAVKDSNGNLLIDHTVLDAPKTGWDELFMFLNEQGIDSPIKLSLDEKYTPVPDGQSIVIEIKSRESYSMIFFSLNTKTEDGQKALKVCQRIEQDFNIEMGC